jgi:hypothetical protein
MFFSVPVEQDTGMSPQAVLESRFGITLPPDAVLDNYTYREQENHFYAKITTNAADIDGLAKQLAANFGDPVPDMLIQTPDFSQDCPWWDMNTAEVAAVYHKLESVGTAENTMYELWAFMTRDKDGGYTVYVAY